MGLERYVEKASIELIMPLIPQADHLTRKRSLARSESLESLMRDQSEWYAFISDNCLIVKDHLAFLDEAQSYDVASLIELARSITPEIQLLKSTVWTEGALERYFGATAKERNWWASPMMIDTYRGLSMDALEGGRVIFKIWRKLRKADLSIPADRLGSVEYSLNKLSEASLAEIAAELSSLEDVALQRISPAALSDQRLFISWSRVGPEGQLGTVVTLRLLAERELRLHVPST